MDSIYGKYADALHHVMADIVGHIRAYSEAEKKKTGELTYEHLIYRIKSEDSIREKCDRKGIPQNEHSALYEIKDALGLRIVCRFIDDIYFNIDRIREIPGCTIIEEKDYIKNVKPNGYRSYHMIIQLDTPYEDVNSNVPGQYFAEIQLRTIAMDTWASLEHQIKYKHNIKNPEIIVKELKRCADDLAACDVSMQTIRNLIRAE